MFPITLVTEPKDEAPSGSEILGALCDRFDAEPEEVVSWLRQIEPGAAYTEYLQDMGILKDKQ